MPRKSKKPQTSMRRFYLKRIEDESGVSGTGIVAEGVEFSNGKCALHWISQFATVTVTDSIKAIEEVHGHGGKSIIEYYE